MPLQNTTLSFAQLDARANQLARHLIQLGAAPERPIGILMRRSLDLFTGLVAILKSGSAYVPMDPDYPPDRLAIMAGDSKACFPVPGQHCFMRNTCLSEPCRNKCPQCHLNAGEVHSYSRSPSKMLSVSVALLQAPVILSQVDLEGKVSEVLAAVEKDRQATGSIESVPKVVLVSFRAGLTLVGALHSALSLQQGTLLGINSSGSVIVKHLKCMTALHIECTQESADVESQLSTALSLCRWMRRGPGYCSSLRPPQR